MDNNIVNTKTQLLSDFQTAKTFANTDTNKSKNSNMILPRATGVVPQPSVGVPIEMKAKVDPVMLRSFNKDLSLAMEQKQKQELVTHKDEVKTSQAPVSIPVAPTKNQEVAVAKSPVPSKPKLPTDRPIHKEKTTKSTNKSTDELLKEKGLLLEISPRPLITAQSLKTSGDTTDEKEKLRTDFDNMILGGYNEEQKKTGDLSSSSRNILTKIKEEITNLLAVEETQQSELSNITKQETFLATEKTQQENQKVQVRNQLDDVLRQESNVEELISAIEKETQGAISAEERHNIEKKRWEQEEKRARIEKNKWTINAEYEKILDELEEKEQKLKQINNKKEEINTNLILLSKAKKEKEVQIQLEEVEQQKREIEDTQIEFLDKKKEIDHTLALLEENKQKVVTERRVAEEDEANADSLSEKRVFEEKRQNTEIRQRSIEQQRWDAEQMLQQIMGKITEANLRYKAIEDKEEKIQKELQ